MSNATTPATGATRAQGADMHAVYELTMDESNALHTLCIESRVDGDLLTCHLTGLAAEGRIHAEAIDALPSDVRGTLAAIYGVGDDGTTPDRTAQMRAFDHCVLAIARRRAARLRRVNVNF